MMDKNLRDGLGSTVPPSRRHVRAYFAEKGESCGLADQFFNQYESRAWLGRSGKLLKDWKMRAWQWIWGRRHGRR